VIVCGSILAAQTTSPRGGRRFDERLAGALAIFTARSRARTSDNSARHVERDAARSPADRRAAILSGGMARQRAAMERRAVGIGASPAHAFDSPRRAKTGIDEAARRERCERPRVVVAMLALAAAALRKSQASQARSLTIAASTRFCCA